jgi:hypothetical protein
VPLWVAFVCVIPCAALLFLEERFPEWLGTPRVPRPAVRLLARLLAPACIVILAVALDQVGAPAGIIVMICAMAVVPYVYDRLRVAEEERHRRELEGNPFRQLGPRLEDWATLGISLCFCLMGMALLLLTPDWRTAVVTLAFFGACAITLAILVARKRRGRRFRALRVSIEGSRDIPMAETQLLVLALGLVLLGGIMFFVGTAHPALFRALGALIALVGAALIGLRLSGLLRRQFLRFEPRGIVIGQRSFEFRLDWDNIRGIGTAELADNPMILLTAHAVTDIEVTPSRARSRLYRSVRQNQWLGADVVIMPWLFGLEMAPLLAALVRYARDPAARQELAPRTASAPKALPAG